MKSKFKKFIPFIKYFKKILFFGGALLLYCYIIKFYYYIIK